MSVHELKELARKHWEKWLPEKVAKARLEGTTPACFLKLRFRTGTGRPRESSVAVCKERVRAVGAPRQFKQLW
jgi:hypothetical protein